MATIKRETRRASSKFRGFAAVAGKQSAQRHAKTALNPMGSQLNPTGSNPDFQFQNSASRVKGPGLFFYDF